MYVSSCVFFVFSSRRRHTRCALVTGVQTCALPIFYATREQRPLHDVITCIRESTNLHDAGRLLRANGERHLKPPQEMRRLFRTCPEAVDESAKILDRIAFSLRDLEYEYPHEPVPAGWEPQSWLEHRVMGAESGRASCRERVGK